MQVIAVEPPPVGKQNVILLITGITAFIAGALLIIFDGELTSAGPMAISGGCCAGCLIILVSMV